MAPNTPIAGAPLSDLPYDLIRLLCKALSGSDVVNLLMTCKSLYAHMSDDSIWRELCTRYGVDNPDELGGGAFFHIYSGILHTYGPLLGLWASDRPFMGGIIEFRIDGEKRGIIGEIWDFEGVRDHGLTPPMPPDYRTFVMINLPLPANAQVPQRATLSWPKGMSRRPSWLAGETREPFLRVLSATNQAVHIRYRGEFTRHPDFPDLCVDAWFARGRELPRLRVRPSPVHSADGEQPGRGHRHMEMYPVLGFARKPPSLCIEPGNHPLLRYFLEHIPFNDIIDLRNHTVKKGSNKVNSHRDRRILVVLNFIAVHDGRSSSPTAPSTAAY